MAIDNALKNPVVTSVLAVKSGDDFVAVGETNKLPVEATNKALPVLSNTGTIGALNAYVEIAVPDNYKTASAIFTDGNDKPGEPKTPL